MRRKRKINNGKHAEAKLDLEQNDLDCIVLAKASHSSASLREEQIDYLLTKKWQKQSQGKGQRYRTSLTGTISATDLTLFFSCYPLLQKVR